MVIGKTLIVPIDFFNLHSTKHIMLFEASLPESANKLKDIDNPNWYSNGDDGKSRAIQLQFLFKHLNQYTSSSIECK